MANKNNRVKSTNDLELKDRLVAINRVTKVTKGGRTFTFAAKSKGSSNPHNLVKATLAALSEMRSPAEIAHQRGISLDKVFNG